MLLLNLLKEEKIRTTEPKAEEFEIVLKVSQARTHLKVQLKNSYFMLVLAPGVCPPGGYLRCPQRSCFILDSVPSGERPEGRRRIKT